MNWLMFTVVSYFILIFNLYQCELIPRKNPIKKLIEETFIKYEKDESIGQLSKVSVDRMKYPLVSKKDKVFIFSFIQVNGYSDGFPQFKLMNDDQFSFGRFLIPLKLCSNQNRTILIIRQRTWTNLTSKIETIFVKPDECEEGAIIKRIHLPTDDPRAIPIAIHGEHFTFVNGLNEIDTNQFYVSIYKPNAGIPFDKYRIGEINLVFRPSFQHLQHDCEILATLDSYTKFGFYNKGFPTIYQVVKFMDYYYDSKEFVLINRTDQSNGNNIFKKNDNITIITVSIVNGTEVKSAPITIHPILFGLGHQFDITGRCSTNRRIYCDTLTESVHNKTSDACYVLPNDCENGAFYVRTNLNTNRNNIISDVPIYLETNSIVNETHWKEILNSDHLILTIERNDLTNMPKVERYFVHEIDVFFRFYSTQANESKNFSMNTIIDWYMENGFYLNRKTLGPIIESRDRNSGYPFNYQNLPTRSFLSILTGSYSNILF